MRRDLRGYVPPFLVVVFGILASWIAYAVVRDHKKSEADAEFSSSASVHANAIVEGFSQALFAIQSVGALYDSSDRVSWNQFSDFTEPLLERFPTIAALGWVPQVLNDQRDEFELSAQELFPGFRITERSENGGLTTSAVRRTYFPVLFIRPRRENEVASGFDLYSDGIRREAIERARTSGETTSTARIRLVQDNAPQYSVLLIHPVFEKGDSTEEEGSALLGVASGVFRFGDGVERALARMPSGGMSIWLFDRSGEPEEQFLFSHLAGPWKADEERIESERPANARRYVHEFDLGGREFELILSPATRDLEASGDYGDYAASLALLVGLGFTALVAAYLELVLRRSRELARGHQALEHQISEREKVEQQLREANASLEILSRKDSLTGIANRRSFEEHFQQEWKRAFRQTTALSLLLGDVDHFKAYNDTHGHLAGDECLREIARVVARSIDRPGDLAARYGGEEFAVVLPDTSESGAHLLAERIRLSVAAIELHEGVSSDARGVTISFGCGSVVPTRTSSIENFTQAVDAALYRAKQQGRNRTVLVGKMG